MGGEQLYCTSLLLIFSSFLLFSFTFSPLAISLTITIILYLILAITLFLSQPTGFTFFQFFAPSHPGVRRGGGGVCV